jgi:uncharacterized membrane protein YczE
MSMTQLAVFIISPGIELCIALFNDTTCSNCGRIMIFYGCSLIAVGDWIQMKLALGRLWMNHLLLIITTSHICCLE